MNLGFETTTNFSCCELSYHEILMSVKNPCKNCTVLFLSDVLVKRHVVTEPSFDRIPVLPRQKPHLSFSHIWWSRKTPIELWKLNTSLGSQDMSSAFNPKKSCVSDSYTFTVNWQWKNHWQENVLLVPHHITITKGIWIKSGTGPISQTLTLTEPKKLTLTLPQY